jgi:RNA polymerase sigma factor (sigma-70 family)
MGSPGENRDIQVAACRATLQDVHDQLFKCPSEEEMSALLEQVYANLLTLVDLCPSYKNLGRKLLRGFADSEAIIHDAGQDAVMQHWDTLKSKLASGERIDKWESYFKATYCHGIFDLIRKRKRYHQHVNIEAFGDPLDGRTLDPAEQAEANEESGLIAEALKGLPDSPRHSIDLYYFKGWKYEEIARELQVPLGTVKSGIHYGLKTLEDRLVKLAPEHFETLRSLLNNAPRATGSPRKKTPVTRTLL